MKIRKIKEINNIPKTHNEHKQRKTPEGTSKSNQKFYAVEENFWKQKAGMLWFADGDGNTKFFHAHVN